MSTPRRPVDQLFDVTVFAPLGLALEARRYLPELAEVGRQRAEAQVALARMVGKFAVTAVRFRIDERMRAAAASTGEETASAAVSENGDRSGGLGVADRVEDVPPTPAEPAPELQPEPQPELQPEPQPELQPEPQPELQPEPQPELRVPSESELAIPAYDSLAASQIIGRLRALDPTDRDLVERYEAAHRRRRTVLGKLDQLRRASGS